MTPAEEKVLKELREQGYSVVHSGAPDFLCFKLKTNQPNPNQSPTLDDIDISSVCFKEIKFNGDTLNHEQIIWRDILKKLGLKYQLINISPEILSGVS